MRKNALLYRPGTQSVDITAPGGIDALLDFHRATFGDARMEDEGSDGGAGGGGDGSEQAASFTDPDTGETYAFPGETPIKEMTSEQVSEYWRHKARKHEDRVRSFADYDTIKAERDALKAKHQTADEKALEDATTAAADSARADERGKYVGRLVNAEFRAANRGRLEDEKLTAVLDGIEPTKFLTSEGEVDTDKVQQFVDGIAPADGKKWPDTGQGRRQSQKSTGVGVGRDLYEARHPKKS